MTRQRVQTYVPPEAYERLEALARAENTTIAPYTKRALLRHIDQVDHGATDDVRDLITEIKIEARETAERHEKALLDAVERLGARLEKRIDQRAALTIAMLDQLAYTLFCHLPEATPRQREAGTRRYRAWKRLTQEIVAEGGQPTPEAEPIIDPTTENERSAAEPTVPDQSAVENQADAYLGIHQPNWRGPLAWVAINAATIAAICWIALHLFRG